MIFLLACADPSPGDKQPGGEDSVQVDTADTADTAPLIDADGDGSQAGDDCDDADATVFPGAVDVCDGVDRDCDGEVVAEGGCGEVIELSDAGPEEFQRDSWFAEVDGVWATSGGDRLVDKTPLEGSDWGGYAIYGWSGGGLGDAASLAESQDDVYGHCTTVGDFDGDGWDDLALHGGSSYVVSKVALVSGDITRWPTELAYIDDAAFAVWGGAVAGDGFSEDLDAGDVDGDGLMDIVTHAPYDVGTYGGKSGWLFVLPGRTEGFPTPAEPDAVREEWYYPHSRIEAEDTPVDEAFGLFAVHPDLDGDGLADVIGRGVSGSYVVIFGETLVSTQGAYIEDLVDVQSAETGRSLLLEPGGCADLDMDGDGVGDCLLDTSEDWVGTVAVVAGAALAGGADPLDAAIVTYTPMEPADQHLVGDIDADGIPEVGFNLGNSDDGTQCILPSTRIPLGGTLAEEDVAPCWHHDDDLGRLNGIAVADIDGSGLPDVILSQNPYEHDDEVPLYLLLDLELPWGDPTRW